MKKRVLLIGHSHLGSLEQFHYLHGKTLDVHLDFIQLLSKEFDAAVEPSAEANLQRAIRKRQPGADIVVLSISGNEHQMMGLVNHPRPFDFVLPERPDLPLLADRELVPFAIIEDALRSWMREDIFEKLSKAINRPVIQLESPPPILDHDHITNYAGAFKDKIAEVGINNPFVRYKLWRVNSNITKSFCEKYRIRYVRAPAEAIGPEGFLHYMALSHDPTHANSWYGSLVMKQIENLLSERA